MNIVRNGMRVAVMALLFGSICAAAQAKGPVDQASNQAESRFLVLAKRVSGGGAEVSVDYYSTGNTAGAHVDLEMDNLEKAGANLAACGTSKLSAGAGWAGGCSMVDGVVRFVVINTNLEPLAPGWHTLGTFQVRSLAESGIRAKTLAAGDSKGQALEVGYDFSWIK